LSKYSELLGGAKKAKALSVAAVLTVLVATLWPFNPIPPNGVTWLKNANGLKFERAGIVVSTEPFKLRQPSDQKSYTLELLLQAASVKFLATILGFYSPTRPAKQFLVMRRSDGLLVTRNPSVQRDTTGNVKFDVDHVFHSSTLVFLAISSGRHGTTVWVNGQRAQDFPHFEIAANDLTGQMVLGTSPTAYRPWNGEMRGLAIYARELNDREALEHYRSWTGASPFETSDREDVIARYLFMEGSGREVHYEVAANPDLSIPARFRVPHKPFLESPIREFRTTWEYAHDLAANVAGFVPLGLIVFSFFAWTRTRWNAAIATVILCGLLSFVIEVSQYYIPKRGSGMTDIITNTLGAALGVLLMQSSLLRKPLERIGVIPTASNVGC